MKHHPLTIYSDSTLVILNRQKAKPVALVQVSPEPNSPVVSCSFGLLDNAVCLAYGRDVFRFYRVLEHVSQSCLLTG
jgi:hypothetical protein